MALFPDFRIADQDLGKGLGFIDEHYRNLSQRYGFSIETPADPMLEYGRLMQDQDEYEKAIEAFEFASSRYPDSASAYYCLGQAYEATDKLPESLAAYKRLLEYTRNPFNTGEGFRARKIACARINASRTFPFNPGLV